MTSEHVPPWRDPLLQRPLEPTGTGSGAYVEQPEPRANPMTVEGEIAAFGEMARGAAHARGWRGVVGKAIIAWLLLGFGAAIVFQIVALLRG